MKRAAAMILAVLMMIQLLPVQAETYSDWFQVETQETPVYHTVRFVADGEEIASVSVADGSSLFSVPEAPEKSGFVFTGWFADQQAVTADTIVTTDMTAEAIYAEETPDAAKAGWDFFYTDKGTYADITIYGTHHKNQEPKASKNDRVGGAAVLEAWTVSNLKNKTSLTAEAVITALPEKGTLSAYTVVNGSAAQQIASGLAVGDKVVFDLSAKGAEGIALVAEKSSGDEPEEDAPVEGTLYANEHLYLTGKIPVNGVIDVQPVEVSIAGEKVLAAYDIKIYNNAVQQKKGKTWQPADKKVQVHFYDKAFEGPVNVYHVPDTKKAGPEYITTVEASEGWVVFEADSFSIYAITQSIEQEVTIGGATYKITVTYDNRAGIPEGSVLDVKEADADEYLSATASALGWSDTDEVFYTKFLDISIVHDGTKVEPKTPVSVTVELLDVKNGAEALEVVHFGDTGAEKVNSTANSDGTVTFSADSFSVFGFGSVLRSLLSWAEDKVTFTIQGFSALLNPTYTAIDVTLEEGLEALSAYNVHSTLGSLLNALYVKVSTALDLGSRESVVVYSVKNGTIADILAEGRNVNNSLSLGGADGFAVVKDSGYRRKVFELGSVELYGMMPKAAEAEANDLLETYTDFAEDVSVIAAFDISIAEDGAAYQPDEEHPVEVAITVPDLSEHTDLQVFHIKDDGTQEEITEFTIEDEKIVFEATGFSVYVVVESVYLRTYKFYTFNEYGEYEEYALYTDSGKTTFTQTIKNGEKPVAPQNPTNPQDPNGTFAGWYEDISEGGGTAPVFAENAYDFDNIPAITENEEIHLYARFNSYAYLVFHDQYNTETGTFPVAYTIREQLTNGSTSVNISSYRTSYHGSGNAMVFTGWSEVPITIPGAANNDLDETVEKLDDTITVTGNKELYPIFTRVYWITFYSGYSGSGATYYPETYYLNGEGPDHLPDNVTRNVGSNGAYTFVGWYAGATLAGEEGKEEANVADPAVKIANADGTLVDDFSDTGDLGISVQNRKIVLTKDVTLYAAWTTTGTAEYSIIIWKQKASDASELAENERSYDFAERVPLTGTIGTIVSVDSSYTTRTYDGFIYSRCDSSKEIAADGSTVLNVYYDREPSATPTGSYALTFADSVTENASSSLPIAYDQDSGDHAKISYGASLSDKVPAAPASGRAGYSFTGWFADQACTIRVFFSAPTQDELSAAGILTKNTTTNTYEPTGKVYIVYETMPDQDVTVYAGWEETKYKVNIDPNYGAMYAYDGGGKLVGTGATYFNGTYTSIIQEYSTVTRDYVESSSGTWYYVKHDRAFYDAGNTVPGNDRYTYYTQDPSEATEFTTFAYEPGVYRYAGWYEVFNYGQADEYESSTPYQFGGPVDHETTLRLHWTKVGAFYLVYDPGIGTLNDNEDQETFYVDLDGDTYADNADVVVTRIATPPEGYEFVGWTIRDDESGTVYYPGRSFTLLTRYAATVQGKKTVYLDAVYTKVPTACIVYHANGGVLTDPGSEQYRTSFGGPKTVSGTDTTVYTLVTTGSDPTVTVSNLVNNSQIILAAGEHFSRLNATFAGWYDKPNYDGGTLLREGSDVDANGDPYYVSADSSVDLYAVWQVSVKYHLNRDDANFGGDWGSGYTLTGNTYTQNAYIGIAVDRPTQTPAYTGSGNLTFRYWATKDDSDNYTMYDFTQPVTGTLDVYAVWGEALTVDIHAADASAETITEKTSSDEDWTVATSLSVTATPIDLSSGAPAASVMAPSEYAYAFAAVHSSMASLQELSESDAVDSIYYNSVDGKIHAVYKNGKDTALAGSDEIYFIYYQTKPLYIGYKTMADDGNLSTATVNSSAPSVTVDPLGQYDMASSVTTPLAWLNDSTYTYYAFAIGSAMADNAKDLTVIASTSNTDTTRPTLLVKNTWRGFQYSTDGGTSWLSCGYEPTLYVVYFAKQATVVTFTENTVGLTADMGTQFTFNYKIETIDRANNNDTETVYDTEASGNSPVKLRNGEAYSTILFTDSATTQKVTVTQTAMAGFTIAVTDNGTTAANPFIYTADGSGTAQNVVFTNTRDTAATVEVHVALVDVANGSITKDDTKRSSAASDYSFDLTLNAQEMFTMKLPSDSLFTDDSTAYAFGAVLYGTDSGSAVDVAGMDVVSISCEPAETENVNVYEVYLKDSAGNRLTELGDYSLYYLYYPMPVVQYMEETDAGALTAIQGSTDGTTVSDTITYNGQPLTLNGKAVTQNQKLEIPQSGIVISQSVGSAYFNMPPLLDKCTDKLYLVYSRIGAGAPGQTNISDISVSDGLTLYLQIRDNKLAWSFDTSDDNSWKFFTQTPTIYAIYQERGYTLDITKTVPIDTGFTDPFTLTISSTAISRPSYAVEGTGSSTITPDVRASGSTPGKITVQVTDGSVIRIFGLGSGEYTITESGNENHILTAKVTYINNEGSSQSDTLTVTNSAVKVTLDREKTLALTNTPKVICKVGTRFFYTIQSAVQWIEDNSATFSGTIEMLGDYLMPSSDAPVIPYYLDITLTTASSYGNGTVTITRSGSFASGAMFTNSGTMTFRNITLDGNSSTVTASSAMIDNEGTLTIGSGATLRNAKNSGNGSAINSWDGSVTVDGGTISNNEAANHGAIYASGGDVTVRDGSVTHNTARNGGAIYYIGTGSVTVSGGSIINNTADNGGAIYLEKGSLAVSGGSMLSNRAAEDGGAVYAANGEIEVSGGTIGGSGTENSAKNGGAIYLSSGSVTVSANGFISHNTASENGGAICTDTAEVTVSGGSISDNTASENGGGVYTASGAITVGSGTTISDNTAASGGGLYSASGTINVDNATISGNDATTGNGGGVYAGSGTMSMNTVTLTGNTAMEGKGGAIYAHSGTAMLTNCVFGGSGSSNSAINGAAVYTDTGSVTFSAGTVSYNTASTGGAVGIGSSTARLNFSGNVKVTNNTMSGRDSNVYLDQDSDAVINATGLESNASIGVHVPDQNVEVTDIFGETSTENLFDRRGVPGAFFATYTSESNVSRFSNDRLQGLTVQMEKTSKRLYWGKAFTVEVHYLASFSGCFPTVAAGTPKNVDNKSSITYYAPSSSNAASEIADNLRSAHTINGLSSSAVFAAAFVDNDRSFANYITDVNWDSSNNRWSFVRRDGAGITGDKLVVYFSEPSYIQIENNTPYPLNLPDLKVLGQPAVNSSTETGYGYVFAVNGVIQNKLRPIISTDLTLAPGKSIKLLFPGGKNAAWTLLNGSFTDASEDIPYTLNGTANTLASANTANFALNGTTLNTNGGTYSIIFGGKSAICRIVTNEINGVQDSEIAGKTIPDGNNSVEYIFSTLNQAVTFAKIHNMTDADIEMLVDYLIPGTDVVSLPASCNFTFSTAVDGTYRYSDDSKARATISRDQGNSFSFITAENGVLVGQNYKTTLRVENLIFDGKAFGGDSISGGIINTTAWNVEIVNVDFYNCKAQFGGGIFIKSVTPKVSPLKPYGRLTVQNSMFYNCRSTHKADKYGGGAIWTSMKELTVDNCKFISCSCEQQGGALFHYLGGDYDSSTTITSCAFEGCTAGQAAGSMESGAKTVRVTDSVFRNSTSNLKNGGAVNVWALDQEKPTAECHVYLTNCTFEQCYANNGTDKNGNGGAMRSTATYNTITNCTFIDDNGNDGGAINIYNENAVETKISNCIFKDCVARNKGGAVFCRSKKLIIDGTSNTIFHCSAQNEGGGIFHVKDATGTEFTIENTEVEKCSSSTQAGGGIYSMAQKVTAKNLTIKDCTAKTKGGGLYLYPKSSSTPRNAVLTNIVVRDCIAQGDGGGIYYDNGNELTISGENNLIFNNESGGMGGGIYTNALIATLTGTKVSENRANSHGGGICHNVNNANGRLTVDSCDISGNKSGGRGGGTYTLAQMTIRNDTHITGNSLNTEVKEDAAGVYLANGRTLTVGTTGATENDASTVTQNVTNSGKPSNLRLSQGNSLTSNNSTNSIDVLCHLSGEFRVIDAYSKGTRFGTSEISSAETPIYTNGFSDIRHVFIADDDSLYGIIDRSDTSLQKIIWAGDPICKITDASGRLLYVDTVHEYPAVFDKLDTNNSNDTSSVSAFSLLRNENPQLFYADGTRYTGNTYQVKMLVESYTATNRISTKYFDGRTIILTTAGSADSQYPYRGRTGTRSTVTRGTAMGNNSFITANVNLTLTNIVLDGGSESGVTANTNTRIISSSQNGVTVTLGRNSALQNASVSGNNNGGAVYLNNASLVIEGGAIRNCSADNGGAVYKDGGNGTVVMTGGSITLCTARNNGGGICIQKGPTAKNGTAFTMLGGSITRCTANKGGGVWLNSNNTTGYKMSMSGGNISTNKATSAGGGIAAGGNKAKLYFSGSAFVYGNTCDASVASTKASNVQMDQDFTVSANKPDTIICTTGLIRGATIGVYVPGNDTGGASTQYDKYGDEADPFAIYEGTPTGLNYFINDRNSLKGGLMEGQAVGTDMKVYWRQIYTLEINLEVLSRAASDKETDFHFTVTLSGTVGGKQWNEVNETYGDLDFDAGVATFTLNGSTNSTAMADLLPLGYGYKVTMDAADAAGFTVYPELSQSGEMNKPSQFLYTVNFRVAKDVVCKITDDTYGLLYYKRGEAYAEAVYDELVSAFNRTNMGELYYKVGDSYIPYTANRHRIEMLIPEYEMKEATVLNAGKKVLLTTADPNADDGFPYAGGNSTAVIKRGYNGGSMITVNGDLSLGNITLDGDGTNHPVSVNGGIVNVNNEGSITVGTGTTLQNATTSGSGAAIYLAQGSRMNISGAPVFNNNISTGVILSGATNGKETYTQARQDIYIKGFSDTDATSLHVTGKITSAEGSIWVWPEYSLHYEQSKQFAVMDGGIYAGLNAFRNAQTDEKTKNQQKTDPLYLYGISRGTDRKVYWSGSKDLIITKTLAGDLADMFQTFEFTVSELDAGDSCAYVRYTSTNGSDWNAATGSGATGTLIANNSGKLDSFRLGHNQRIVISIPTGSSIRVTETNGMYTTSYVIDDGSSTAGSTAEITMNDDKAIAFTNTLNAVSPTGVSFTYTPFFLMAAAGMIIGLIGTVGRKRRRGEGGDVND